jgi:hypothetical protein
MQNEEKYQHRKWNTNCWDEGILDIRRKDGRLDAENVRTGSYAQAAYIFKSMVEYDYSGSCYKQILFFYGNYLLKQRQKIFGPMREKIFYWEVKYVLL